MRHTPFVPFVPFVKEASIIFFGLTRLTREWEFRTVTPQQDDHMKKDSDMFDMFVRCLDFLFKSVT